MTEPQVKEAESPTLGSYAILERIGVGGMSAVHRAIDLRHGRVVAIKLLSPQIGRDATFRARFKREVRLLQKLQHPNIVPILDFGEVAGQAYIVMPYMASGTLADRMRKGPIPAKEYARMIDQLASALEFAHKSNVVHRDVKPSNLLLDENGNALLSDFSFAYVADASLSLTGSAVIGTPAYMSPEQCRGDDVDGRSDQYSLAIMAYQLAVGRLPYEAESAIAVAIMHVNDPLPDPKQLNRDLSDSVCGVLVRALSKNPDDRFADVVQFNAALQSALAPEVARVSDWRDWLRVRGLAPRRARGWLNPTPSSRLKARRRLGAAMLGVLLVLGSPLAAWALAGGSAWEALNGRAAVNSPTPTAQDLMATVYALSTENAPKEGTAVAEGQVETAVYETLVAMGAIPDKEQLGAALEAKASATPTPTPTAGMTVLEASDPQATTSGSHGGHGQAGPTSSPASNGATATKAGPTTTRSQPSPMTPTAAAPTETPGSSAQPASTATSIPSTPVPPTSPPPAFTSTPVPPTPLPAPTDVPPEPTIKSNQCKDDPGHPHYCTPTP